MAPQQRPHGHAEQREILALRKELLVTRAALERAQIAESVAGVRHKLRGFGLVKALLSGASQRFGAGGGMLARAYPLLGSVLSLAFNGRGGRRLARLQRAARFVALATAGWEAWKIWRRTRRDTAASTRQ